MSDILLNYAFKISTTVATPQASTSMLKKVLLVVKPKGETPATIVSCTGATALALLTDNVDGVELFNAGMSSIYVLPTASLDLDAIINPAVNNFYTVIISSDFTTANVDAMDLGTFPGVVAYADDDKAWLKTWNTTASHVGMYAVTANGAKNLCYAFGKLLSSSTWLNQQYISMPHDDLVVDLGIADGLFDDRISFVITSPEYGKRLAFLGNGKAVTAKYIVKEIEILTQSRALSYISANMPAYTIKEAVLLEQALGKVIEAYIPDPITSGSIAISLVNDNFEATGAMTLSEPRAFWKVDVSLVIE